MALAPRYLFYQPISNYNDNSALVNPEEEGGSRVAPGTG